MDYSKDLLKRISELAGQLTPVSEIAVLLDIDEVTFLDDVITPGHEARRAYMHGYAKTANEIRKRNLDLAAAGSPAADEALRSYLRRMTTEL